MNLYRFFADLPCVPPDRDTNFCINLELEMYPISTPPYKIELTVLRKLKAQLQELLNKRFIPPSVSLWHALVLFVKKKDASLCICIDYQ